MIAALADKRCQNFGTCGASGSATSDALLLSRRPTATLVVPVEAMSQPQRLVPRALMAKGCTTVVGAGVDNWQAAVAGAGGSRSS